ncbi:MAG: nucleotide sugar dehydrogenase [Acidimicrobiia bacterium]
MDPVDRIQGEYAGGVGLHRGGADVAILGLGYVGLPTGLAFVTAGVAVAGVDASPERLAAIRAQEVDLGPSDRADLSDALENPGFVLTDDTSILTEADAIIVCVPTPVDAHLNPDLRILAGACKTVVAHARAGQTIILTSTTYVGTTRELLEQPLAERGLVAGRDVFIAFSPERIDPGNTQFALRSVPRVVGGISPECSQRARALLSRICAEVHLVSSAETAEMTKLYENVYRAVNIALANEISDVARAFTIDPRELIEAAATKPYGFTPFYPGPGVGGHCIPCDPHYLRWQLRALREESPLIDQAMDSIARRPRRVVGRITDVLAEPGIPLSRARILVYGVSYKPRVCDTRESPAIEIIEELLARGASVDYYDSLVASVELRGGAIHSLPAPDGDWDLVLAHTVHSDADTDWLTRCPIVLDASYRLPRAAGIVTV